MPQFRKKPVVVEAMQFTQESKDEAFYQFVTCRKYAAHDDAGNPTLKIETLEGVMTASLGDWIIKGVKGEFYPCKDEIFAATYEAIKDGVTVTVLTPPRCRHCGEIVT